MVVVPFAVCLIREGPAYRRAAFVGGLQRLGYRVGQATNRRVAVGDLLVLWNRHGQQDDIARRYLAAGKPVIVAENGYIGKDDKGRSLYALARTNHNGAGAWHVGAEDRWAARRVELKPWRADGRHILLLPQRGVGPQGVAMPLSWPKEIQKRLRASTDRPVRVRPHPGKDKPSLEPDLRDCWAVVTWGSGAAIKALAAGVPVFHELRNWIGAPAARFGLADLEQPFVGDRLPMFQRLAWAQHDVAEIETGEPFKRLLALP